MTAGEKSESSLKKFLRQNGQAGLVSHDLEEKMGEGSSWTLVSIIWQVPATHCRFAAIESVLHSHGKSSAASE